jgi:hypothetical protein
MGRSWACAAVLAGITLALQPLNAAEANAGAPACQFKLGFAVLDQALGARVGACLDDESYNGNGDSVQHAAGGLLVWRRADNWTAFTDGYQTWVNGPNGIQRRLNTERFAWEGSEPAPVAQAIPGTVSQSSTVTAANTCSAVARSGSVSATGLNSSVVITGTGAGDTTVVRNQSTTSSSPGVTTTGC